VRCIAILCAANSRVSVALSAASRCLHSFLHDALPILHRHTAHTTGSGMYQYTLRFCEIAYLEKRFARCAKGGRQSSCLLKSHTLDRKSTRLNSSHVNISYAVFCLKKKRRTCEW